jgi:hypothetical protein
VRFVEVDVEEDLSHAMLFWTPQRSLTDEQA